MALAQVIYVSRRTKELTAAGMAGIVAHSAENNARRDITGVLMCCGNHLMQLLEGELADVMTVFERIRTDARHTDVSLLLCKNVSKRLYPEWGMGLADLDCRERLDQDRLTRLVEDVRATHDTARHSVEARLLMYDFKQQLGQPL